MSDGGQPLGARSMEIIWSTKTPIADNSNVDGCFDSARRHWRLSPSRCRDTPTGHFNC
jgi:hypothetical protein